MPRTLAISHRKTLPGDFESWLDLLEGNRIEALQLREKDLDDRSLLALGKRALGRSPRLFVNGRIDLVLTLGAAGVHLPQRALPASALRERFGQGLIFGASTHHPGEVATARDAGIDFVVFGPVFPPLSKTTTDTIPGLEGLRQAVEEGLPVLALGGITAARLAAVADCGAYGVAGISTFQDPRELPSLIAEFERLWPSSAAHEDRFPGR
ncbi:MAG: thiamine phosphate synthase [Acidobacteriota bacterium]